MMQRPKTTSAVCSAKSTLTLGLCLWASLSFYGIKVILVNRSGGLPGQHSAEVHPLHEPNESLEHLKWESNMAAMMRQQTHQAASKPARNEEVPSLTRSVDSVVVAPRSRSSGNETTGRKPGGVVRNYQSWDASTRLVTNSSAAYVEFWASRPHGPPPSDPAIVGSTWPPPDPRMLAHRRASEPVKFPPKQPAELCKAKGQSGGPLDMNKKLIDSVKVAQDNADGQTVMCLVYTIAKNHPSAAACRDTWASRCDGFVVMSNEADPTLPSALVTHEGPEEYGNIWQKVRSIWKYVHAAYTTEFDWFFIGGDDLFVIPSNLRAYLHSPAMQEASMHGEKPMFIGRRFQIPHGQLFNSGGAGYGLNRAALKLLVDHLDDPKCRPHQKVFAEDVNVAHCLAVLGVIPHDTRDFESPGLSAVQQAAMMPQDKAAPLNQGEEAVLRERFHPFTPGQHLTWQPPKKRKSDGSSQDWYENYNAPWGIGLGAECCSPHSASFHYVKPNLMPHLSALLYECRGDS